MSTEHQIAANRANAQHSTGPTSDAGKAKAAKNGLTHGLNSNPETLFAAKPEEAEAFRALSQKLRKDCVPESALEEYRRLRTIEVEEERRKEAPPPLQKFKHLHV